MRGIDRQLALRMVLVLAGSLALLVVLPRLIGPADPPVPVLHGERTGAGVRYDDALLADVLADIERLTGFRAVAFPAVGARRFSGRLTIGDDGQGAAEALAARMGLELRQAGPHWAVVERGNDH